jgi:hypothetical protein
MVSSDARRRLGGRAAHAALVLVATLAAVAVPATNGFTRQRKPAVVEAPPPPPPPPAGPVGLPDRMLRDAAAYDSYIRTASATSPAFADATAVSSALKQVGAYSPKTLVRGAVAYGAIAALEDAAFVASVREAGNTPEHRREMVGYIIANPAYVALFTDAGAAGGLVREAIGPASLQLYATGRVVKQSAYDIQKQAWSKAQVADLQGRLSGAEAQAQGEMTPDPDRLSAARQSVAGVAPIPLPNAPLPNTSGNTPLVSHALQLAAIAALGEATDAAYDQLASLAVDDDTQACLAAAKRNFHQCLAVAKPNYEDIFCMGQHGLRDTGTCMARAAGFETPPEPLPPAPAPKPAKSTAKVIHRHKRG